MMPLTASEFAQAGLVEETVGAPAPVQSVKLLDGTPFRAAQLPYLITDIAAHLERAQDELARLEQYYAEQRAAYSPYVRRLVDDAGKPTWTLVKHAPEAAVLALAHCGRVLELRSECSRLHDMLSALLDEVAR